MRNTLLLSKFSYDNRKCLKQEIPKSGVTSFGTMAPNWNFQDSHFVADIFLIIHAKFHDSSFNRLGAMALGVKKLWQVLLDQVDGAIGAHFGLHHWIP